jgi:FkbM family methyltransferase
MGTEPATPRPLADIIDCPLPTLDIFDIGAMLEDGRDHYDALVAQNLARVTGLEPKQVALDRLTQRAGPYRYFPLFLGDGGTATCHFTHYTGCSSLFEPDPAIIGLFETMGAWEGWDFHVIKAERVRATRLDDLRDEIRADYIKIDVQGAELLVLCSGRRCSPMPSSSKPRPSSFRSIAASLSSATSRSSFAIKASSCTIGRCRRTSHAAGASRQSLCPHQPSDVGRRDLRARLLPDRRLWGRQPGQGRHHPSYRLPILRPRGRKFDP